MKLDLSRSVRHLFIQNDVSEYLMPDLLDGPYFLMELSFVKEGRCSGGLGRLVVHAANACLTLDVRKSETGRCLDYTLEQEAFAISRLIAPVHF